MNRKTDLLVDLVSLSQREYLAPIDVHFAHLCAEGLEDEADCETVSLVAACASRALRQGHPCLLLGDLCDTEIFDEAGESLGHFPDRGTVEGALERAPSVTQEGERGSLAGAEANLSHARRALSTPLVMDRSERLYLARYYDHEVALASGLARLARPEAGALRTDPPWSEAVGHALERYFPPLSEADEKQVDWQRKAAERALVHRLCVISGGPGTGKTSTVVKILALLLEQAREAGKPAPRIALLAPTGKAAARLVEAVSGALGQIPIDESLVANIPTQAMTIHRALGRSRRSVTRFLRGPERPLLADVVLVDEASMVDLNLMRHLVDALSDTARLILLGDRNQLASVEAGSVLSEVSTALARSEQLVELKKSYRFSSDSGIFALASCVKDGDAPKTIEILRAARTGQGFSDLGFVDLGLESELGSGPAARSLERAAMKHLGKALRCETAREALELCDGFRILCAHRHGPSGVTTVNEQIRHWLVRAGVVPAGGTYYRGRLLLVTKNDYGVGLSNGDIGLCFPDERGKIAVYFRTTDGRLRAISPHQLPDHETAFAMTIHKSQGSEYGEVAVLLPEESSPLLTRELLYTAVTRARKRAVVYATEGALRAACVRSVSRSSGLADRFFSQLKLVAD